MFPFVASEKEQQGALVQEKELTGTDKNISSSDGDSIETHSRKRIDIDVQCKQFTMMFPKYLSGSKGSSMERSVPTASGNASKSNATQPAPKLEDLSATSRKLSRHKKAKVLNCLNINGLDLNGEKREKRKRFVGDDQEIAAENIPLDAVLPGFQYGVNTDISPKKRRRLQSLISPMSPHKGFNPFI